jgi:Flp pilus assembly protein TadD
MLQKLDAAIANYQLAVQFDEKNSQAYSNLGVAYYRQGKLDDSINAFKRAVALEPNNAQFKVALADVLKKAGRSKEAKEINSEAEASEKGKKKKKG